MELHSEPSSIETKKATYAEIVKGAGIDVDVGIVSITQDIEDPKDFEYYGAKNIFCHQQNTPLDNFLKYYWGAFSDIKRIKRDAIKIFELVGIKRDGNRRHTTKAGY